MAQRHEESRSQRRRYFERATLVLFASLSFLAAGPLAAQTPAPSGASAPAPDVATSGRFPALKVEKLSPVSPEASDAAMRARPHNPGLTPERSKGPNEITFIRRRNPAAPGVQDSAPGRN